MRVMITESRVREILRREIVKRMLMEKPEDRLVDFGIEDVMGSGSEGEGAPAAGSPSGRSTVLAKKQDPYAGGGIKSGEDVYEAIARVLNTNVELVRGAPDIGPETGQKIIDFLARHPRSIQEATFTDPSTVKQDWVDMASNVTPIEVKGMDGSVEQTISFTPDAEGLLLYLIAVDVAGTGLQLIEADIAERDGMLSNPKFTSTLDLMREGIEGYTDQSDIRAMLVKFRQFVKEDASPGLFKTKVLLAKYAADNWTTGEIAMGTAVGVGAVLAVAALFYGGAVLLAGAAGGTVVGGGLGGAIALSGMELSTAGLAATLAGQTGVLTTLMSTGGTALVSLATSSTLLSGTSFAAAAISGWLVSDDIEDMFTQSAFGELAGYLADPEALTEFSRELRATFGGDETDRALEAFASAVDAVVAGDSKGAVLMQLNQAEKLMVGF